MKKIIVLLIAIILSNTANAQVDTKAEQLLDVVSEKMNTYENIYVEFNYKLHNAEENVNQETRGNVTMKGDLYNVNFLGVNQLFDGKKVYTIISEDEEVNVSDADAEDA
ncbi:MAG: outer membrane lipoprotein carrier protein LolA, partial [Aureibaculum sp.]|nr:outer membrane lipoprotein carrier protein LolA [Aureibaculum sp.]